VVRHGVDWDLETQADALIFADRDRADRQDILSDTQLDWRISREVYTASGTPDAALLLGMCKRAANAYQPHLNGRDAHGQAPRRWGSTTGVYTVPLVVPAGPVNPEFAEAMARHIEANVPQVHTRVCGLDDCDATFRLRKRSDTTKYCRPEHARQAWRNNFSIASTARRESLPPRKCQWWSGCSEYFPPFRTTDKYCPEHTLLSRSRTHRYPVTTA
jgi:hypothetical protein